MYKLEYLFHNDDVILVCLFPAVVMKSVYAEAMGVIVVIIIIITQTLSFRVLVLSKCFFSMLAIFNSESSFKIFN